MNVAAELRPENWSVLCEKFSVRFGWSRLREFLDETSKFSAQQIAIIRDAAGALPQHVVKLSAHMVDLSDWSEVNAVCAAMRGDHHPSRIVAPCGGGLGLGSCIEMNVIAACESFPAMLEK